MARKLDLVLCLESAAVTVTAAAGPALRHGRGDTATLLLAELGSDAPPGLVPQSRPTAAAVADSVTAARHSRRKGRTAAVPGRSGSRAAAAWAGL